MNTAPKPLTVAGTEPFVPGTKKDTSVILLPIGENIRSGLKAPKVVLRVGLLKSGKSACGPLGGA